MPLPTKQALLEVHDLVVEFNTPRGMLRAVDGISFTIEAGQTLGVVGESGCGKSVTALSILGLIKQPPGQVSGGPIFYQGQNLLSLKEKEMRSIRGNDISMIFQEPMTSLNPVFTTGEQVSESIRLHQGKNKKEATEMTIELFRLVGIPSPAQRIHNYPHQMSGGMRQRIMIAMALACTPKLLIADEPTTALDVTIQAQILDLLKNLQRERNMGILLITHDLGIVAQSCDQVLVMYAGQIVEQSSVAELFKAPKHPYTRGLLKSIPDMEADQDLPLHEIPGMVPTLYGSAKACSFADRCEYVQALCREEKPPLISLRQSLVRCHYPPKDQSRPELRT